MINRRNVLKSIFALPVPSFVLATFVLAGRAAPKVTRIEFKGIFPHGKNNLYSGRFVRFFDDGTQSTTDCVCDWESLKEFMMMEHKGKRHCLIQTSVIRDCRLFYEIDWVRDMV